MLLLFKEIVFLSIYNRVPSFFLLLFFWRVVTRLGIIFKGSCHVPRKLGVTFHLCLPLGSFFLQLNLLEHLYLVYCRDFPNLLSVVFSFSIFTIVITLIFLFTLLWFFLWGFCGDIYDVWFGWRRVEITTRMYIW